MRFYLNIFGYDLQFQFGPEEEPIGDEIDWTPPATVYASDEGSYGETGTVWAAICEVCEVVVAENIPASSVMDETMREWAKFHHQQTGHDHDPVISAYEQVGSPEIEEPE